MTDETKTENICVKCPQFKRVCAGRITYPKYCFFFHGDRLDKQIFQSQSMSGIMEFLKNDSEPWLIQEGFIYSESVLHVELKPYFCEGFYIVLIKDGNTTPWIKPYPIGYLRTDDDSVQSLIINRYLHTNKEGIWK